MGKYENLLARVLKGTADASIRFDDPRRLLTRLGFVERFRSSHHLFRYPGLEVLVNLQAEGSMAKSYQVKQVRVAIIKIQQGT